MGMPPQPPKPPKSSTATVLLLGAFGLVVVGVLAFVHSPICHYAFDGCQAVPGSIRQALSWSFVWGPLLVFAGIALFVVALVMYSRAGKARRAQQPPFPPGQPFAPGPMPPPGRMPPPGQMPPPGRMPPPPR